jgi:hypothetical protein
VYTAEQVFGYAGADLARQFYSDAQTPSSPAIATTEQATAPPLNPFRALMDPSHSAIFWVGLAALLGLVLVSGQFRVAAMVGGGTRVGRR